MLATIAAVASFIAAPVVLQPVVRSARTGGGRSRGTRPTPLRDPAT